MKISARMVVATFGLVLGSATLASGENSVEQAKYTVVESVGSIELREYAPRLVAQTTVEAENRDAASSKAFKSLAGYIFGANKGAKEIAMTAPVTTEQAGTKIDMTAPVTTSGQGEGKFDVQFTMPAKWTMETLPEPLNPAVKLIELPSVQMIAYRFTGARTDAKVETAITEISRFAEERNLNLENEPTLAGYDSPMVPVEKRRWDVMKRIAQVQ